MRIRLEIIVNQAQVHILQAEIPLFDVLDVRFHRQNVALRRVACGTGKHEVPDFVVLDERPRNAVVYGCRRADSERKRFVAVKTSNLPEALQRRAVCGQVVPLGRFVKFVCERVGIFLVVHFFKIFYPFVVVDFLKVTLVLHAGVVRVGIESDSAVRLAERIQLPFRVAVEILCFFFLPTVQFILDYRICIIFLFHFEQIGLFFNHCFSVFCIKRKQFFFKFRFCFLFFRKNI